MFICETWLSLHSCWTAPLSLDHGARLELGEGKRVRPGMGAELLLGEGLELEAEL